MAMGLEQLVAGQPSLDLQPVDVLGEVQQQLISPVQRSDEPVTNRRLVIVQHFLAKLIEGLRIFPKVLNFEYLLRVFQVVLAEVVV